LPLPTPPSRNRRRPRNRDPLAVYCPDDHAALLIDGIECPFDDGAAGLKSRPLARARRALQPEPPDFTKAAAPVPDAAEFRPRVRQDGKQFLRPDIDPSAASEVAGVGRGLGRGYDVWLPKCTTTDARRSPATASASSRMPASFCRPASTSLGHFKRKLHMVRSRRPSNASRLPFAAPPRAQAPRQSPASPQTAGETRSLRGCCWEVTTGAIQGRLPSSTSRPVCSDVTNHIRSRLAAARARHGFRVGRVRCCRTQRAGILPMRLEDRARMSFRTATSPRPFAIC